MTVPGIDLSCCWDFADCTPEEGLARLKSYGFEGIELWPNAIERFGGAEAWSKALRDTGMTCFQLCPYFDFVHWSEGIDRSNAELDLFLGYAKILDCKRLRVFTGPVPKPYAVGGHEATEDQWQAAIDTLREFCDLSAGQGIELCLECHEGMLMEDSAGALKLITAVARPNLTTNLQIPLLREDWTVSVERLGPYTTHMHTHNWTGPSMSHDRLTFLSEGVFDWEPVLKRLVLDQGRHVCVSVEHLTHGRKDDPWETARRDGPFLQKLRERVMAR